LAALAFAGKLSVFPIILIGVLEGVANSFNLPIRQSLISELVPREKIVNAVALNGASLTLTLALGPALGGIVVGALGVKHALLLNTISFIAVLWALFAMEIPKHGKKHEKSITQSLKESFAYIAGHKVIVPVVLFSFLMVAIGLPYITLLPVFAKDYFGMGASGYGYLFSIAGIGALLGSLFSAVRSKENVKNAMLLSFIGFGLMLVLFGAAASLTPDYTILFVLLLIMLGFFMATFNTTNNTILQMQVSSEYLGRVLSTLFLGFGLTSLGSFVAGWIAELFGAHVTYIIAGSTILASSVFLVHYTKERRMHD
ncbi:MAG: MFS transporter, partial [Verrucomicrobiota bacterium]